MRPGRRSSTPSLPSSSSSSANAIFGAYEAESASRGEPAKVKSGIEAPYARGESSSRDDVRRDDGLESVERASRDEERPRATEVELKSSDDANSGMLNAS